MPDITLCLGQNCPLKENCLRFVSKGDMYGQSYFMDIPYDQESKTCEHIIDTTRQIEQKDINI